MKSKHQDRDTVGSIYIDAQKNSVEGLTIGEIGEELLTSLIDDINETIASNPYEDRPFYLNVVEERDLQMKNAIKRRIFTTLYRPYPEDNTMVYYVEPKTNKVCFCWDMPHHSEMWNILANWHEYDPDYIRMIREWQNNDLRNFGFEKTPDGEHWIPNLEFEDQVMTDKKKKKVLILEA